MGNIFVPEVVLERPGVMALIGELKPTGVPQHVGMDWERQFGKKSRYGRLACALLTAMGPPRSVTNR